MYLLMASVSHHGSLLHMLPFQFLEKIFYMVRPPMIGIHLHERVVHFEAALHAVLSCFHDDCMGHFHYLWTVSLRELGYCMLAHWAWKSRPFLHCGFISQTSAASAELNQSFGISV